ncbi:16498_t:CDS:2 [Dentiscutata erythropus]|uniref:16498_t:CDS:1 n=1 Tax=Dentiscutata erythropus TaxID=1348616 RepID=A0A9N9DSJ5_9GLOM|nr:16498_t:CDS:2 [Dentiscutata erythropus]
MCDRIITGDSFEQPTYPPITLTSSSSSAPSYFDPTSTNKELWSEIKLLNNRVERLESKLELYKNPGTSPLC